jgi:hypothetical protein
LLNVLASYILEEECSHSVHAFAFGAQKIKHVLLSHIPLLKCSLQVHLMEIGALTRIEIDTLILPKVLVIFKSLI